MEQLLRTLMEIGLSAEEVKRAAIHYRDDERGLQHYVVYMRALLDDRHEYVD